jgi:hypothetical protein
MICATALGNATVVIDHNDSDVATGGFRFSRVPSPGTNSLPSAKFAVVEGEEDSNCAGVDALQGGPLPEDEDQPDRNFFFAAGTPGGILELDMKKVTPIWQVNTYSWHPGSRAPQVYKLYGAKGSATAFKERPPKGADPTNWGWVLIAKVDTRTDYGDEGGQYGVSVQAPSGKLGDYHYLLFVCSATETSDAFGNTFYSRIDILNHPNTQHGTGTSKPPAKPFVVRTPDAKYEITIDSSRAPDMKQWAETKLAPVLVDWYPKIVAFLPSDGYAAPQHFKVIIRPGRGVADTAGTRVNAYVPWLQKETNGQSIGALVHEMVHVVQQYGQAQRNPGATENPGWLVEGMADYVRWYLYEPQSHGADISPNHVARVHYDDAYRPTANFLNWVSEKYDKKLVTELNAVLRQGKYEDTFWTQHTGKTVEQLGDEWKAQLKAAKSP